ncbi:hypothetical protein O0L34_g2962 [Tuta absoluta]|nr:hypothetical protein O0L34_g2962 [Tuta absoluta]
MVISSERTMLMKLVLSAMTPRYPTEEISPVKVAPRLVNFVQKMMIKLLWKPRAAQNSENLAIVEVSSISTLLIQLVQQEGLFAQSLVEIAHPMNSETTMVILKLTQDSAELAADPGKDPIHPLLMKLVLLSMTVQDLTEVGGEELVWWALAVQGLFDIYISRNAAMAVMELV